MKNPIRLLLISLLALATSAQAGSMPSMNVIVSTADGKVAYKGATKADGTFATGNLAPGDYVVEFKSNGAVSGQYALVVSAGKQKQVAEAVPGKKFAGGGVAMRLNVGKGLNITGHVSSTREGVVATSNSGNARVKVVNGKKYIWQAAETGSNMGGHWVEEGTASARNVQSVDTGSVMDTGGRH